MIFRLLRQSLLGETMAAFSLGTALIFALLPDLGLLIGMPFLFAVPIFMSQRATPFEAALPVRARDVFLVRTLYGLALTWLPLLVWIVVAELHGAAPQPVRELFSISLQGKLTVALIAATVIVAPHAVRPGQLGLPAWLSGSVTLVVLLIEAGLAIYVLTPAMQLLFFGSALIALFYLTWLTFPESFQIAPAKARASWRIFARPLAGVGKKPVASSRWWMPIFRSGITKQAVLSTLAVMFTSTGMMWFFFLIGNVASGWVMVRQQTRWMYSLPLSSRNFLWTICAPVLLPLMGGLLLFKSLFLLVPFLGSMSDSAPHQYSRTDSFHRDSRVALEFWHLVTKEEPSVVRAPWGETSALDTLSVFGVVFHNPYSAEKTNSKEFRDWQFARATTAVFGHAITFAEYNADDFNYPPRVTDSARVTILGGGLLLAIALFVVFLCELARSHSLARVRYLQGGIVVLACIAIFALFFVDMFYTFTQKTAIIVPLSRAALLQVSSLLPGGFVVVTVVALVPVIVMYLLVERQFRRSEFSDRAFATRAW